MVRHGSIKGHNVCLWRNNKYPGIVIKRVNGYTLTVSLMCPFLIAGQVLQGKKALGTSSSLKD